MRREKTQISKIRNEQREITTNTKKIQRIIRDKFLDTYDHPKVNQEDINHWSELSLPPLLLPNLTGGNKRCIKDRG
jgi:hypothetical protein